MLKKRLFVALSNAVAPAEQMLAHVTEHLQYMNRLEAEGFLFASGPFVQEGVLVGRARSVFIATAVYLFASLVLTHSKHVRRLTSRALE